MATVPCPTCQKLVNLAEKTPFRPFCSERCRLIDLGAWANEDYQIAGPAINEQNGELELDIEEQEDWADGKLH